MTSEQHPQHARLSVCLVSLEWPSETHVGGVGHYAFRYAKELVDLVSLAIVTLEGGTALPGAEMHYIRRPRARFGRFYLAPLAVRRLVQSLPHQVVHAFGDDWALHHGHFKWVRTFHGSALREARSSRPLRAVNHLLLYALEQLTAQRADVRVVVQPEDRRAFNASLVVPPVSSLSSTPVVSPTPDPSVVFIGSWHGRKRGWLAEQVVQEAQRRLGRDIRLLVVGPANDAENWSSTTEHHHGVSDSTVQELIAGSWALLSTSSYEGFGIPMYESLAQGVQVVATKNPGSTYIKSFTSTGVDICEEDELVDALTGALRKIPLSAAQKDPMKAAAAELAELGSAARILREAYGLLP